MSDGKVEVYFAAIDLICCLSDNRLLLLRQNWNVWEQSLIHSFHTIKCQLWLFEYPFGCFFFWMHYVCGRNNDFIGTVQAFQNASIKFLCDWDLQRAQISISGQTYSESMPNLKSNAYFLHCIRTINQLGQFKLSKSHPLHELDANSISGLHFILKLWNCILWFCQTQ